MHLGWSFWEIFIEGRQVAFVAFLVGGCFFNSIALNAKNSNLAFIENNVDNNHSSFFRPIKNQTKNLMVRGYLGMQSVHHFNEHFAQPEARSIHYVEGRLTRPVQENSLEWGMDLQGHFGMAQSWLNSYSVNELFIQWTHPGFSSEKSERAVFFMGRRQSSWSYLDEKWKIGAFQPLNKVDPFNVSSQGLTGAFVNWQESSWSLEFFATPFFLPDQGAPIEITHGRFIRKNPWVYYPPSEKKINGVLTPIAYTLDQPTDWEIVSHAGVGLKAQWGSEKGDGFLGRVAWARKPMNQMLLGLNGFLVLQEEAIEHQESQVQVQLRPEVGYHDLKSIDLIFRKDIWFFAFSFLEDLPDKNEFAYPWTYQRPQAAVWKGISFGYTVGERHYFGGDYLQRQGGDGEVYGPEKDLVEDYIPERYAFADLVKMEYRFQKNIRSSLGFEGIGEWKKELRENSEWLTIKNALLIGKSWKASLGVDVLKSENTNPKRTDFIKSHLASDRVYGGIHYVF